jgi:uridine kinase
MYTNMNNIEISVNGYFATGKSTIAKLIESALLKEGIQVQLEDDSKNEDIASTVHDRAKSLIENELKVKIKTKNVSKTKAKEMSKERKS